MREDMEKQRKAVLSTLAGEFEVSIGKLVGGVMHVVSEMDQVAKSVATSSEQTKAQAASVADAARLANGNVQAVAAAASELSKSFGEINQRTNESTTIVGQAVREANVAANEVASLAVRAK